MKSLLYIGLFTALTLTASAQKYRFFGYVYDAETKEALQYVNVWEPNLRTGTISDINGKFVLITEKTTDSIRLSCIGYETIGKRIDPNQNNLHFYLKPKVTELREARIVAKENPAHRILRLIHEHKKENNPYYFPSYQIKQYSKTFFSSETVNDSLGQVFFLDTVDTASYQMEIYQTLQTQHLFLQESVVELNYKFPGKKNDILLASKISGFSDPIFQLLTTQMQSFSFYDDKYSLLFNTFSNPLSDKNFNYYFFWIEDTTYVGKDTLFTISFKPLKNKDFQGITGEMTINSDGWAVQDVLASPIFKTEMITIVMQQHYEKIDAKYWFPVYTHTKLNLKFTVNTIPITSYSSTKNKNIKIDIPLKNNQFISDELLIDSPEAYERKSDSILAIFRDTSISSKEEETYLFWDTIPKDLDIDKSLFIAKTLLSGNIPVKWINFKIDKILKLTGLETVRLGVGIETNDRLSEWFLIGGYIGYGFKDEKLKWGLNSSVLLEKRRKLRISAAAYHDIFKAGSNVDKRFEESYRFSLSNANNLILITQGLLKNYDYIKHADIGISSFINRWLEGKISFSYTMHDVAFNYNFSPLPQHSDEIFSYTLTEVSLYLKISSKSTIYSFGSLSVSNKTSRPLVEFLYSRGIKGLFKSDFAYNWLDIKISQTINIKPIGNFSYYIKGGFIDRDLPYSSLYGIHGSWIKFDIFDPFSFATMRINEFLSDKYISLQLSQKFPALYNTKISAPVPQLLFHTAWGDLRHPEYHQGTDIQFNRMNRGYFEGGVALHNLLIQSNIVKIGFGVFYRFGHYMLPDIIDNFNFKISLTLLGT